MDTTSPKSYAKLASAYKAKEQLANIGYTLDIEVISDWEVKLKKVRGSRHIKTLILPEFLTSYSRGALKGLNIERVILRSHFKSYDYLFSELKSKQLQVVFETPEIVESTNFMFYGCNSLESLSVGQFETSEIKRAIGMFGLCKNLMNLELPDMNMPKVEDTSSMFYGCKLRELDLTSFITTDNLKCTNDMFKQCNELINLKIPGLNTSNVVSAAGMFYYCCSLQELDLSHLKFRMLESTKEMFENCGRLRELILPDFSGSRILGK